jgi:hypothetical protein
MTKGPFVNHITPGGEADHAARLVTGSEACADAIDERRQARLDVVDRDAGVEAALAARGRCSRGLFLGLMLARHDGARSRVTSAGEREEQPGAGETPKRDDRGAHRQTA